MAMLSWRRGQAASGGWRSRGALLGSAVLGLTQLAMFCGPGDPGPCGSDRFNCDDGDPNAFIQKAECAPIATPLSIEFGGGYNALTPFDLSAEPPFERGGQGGQHLATAYRVSGADLTQSERLRVSLRMTQPSGTCEGDAGDVYVPDGADTSCEDEVGQRVMVRGGPTFPLKPDGQGFITETGIIVILNSWTQVRMPFHVVATVEDQCGRSAETEVIFMDNP